MWNKVWFSFPVQLLVLHIRKNIFLLLFWAIFVLIVMRVFGSVLGIPYLFLDPEYLNKVSWQGFFLMGIGFAIFTTAFHMTTYILDGVKFKFLAVLKRPFIHFCLNNSVIPLIFYILYIYNFIGFQLDNELESKWDILHFVFGFLGGSLLTFALVFLYFNFTNKDFFILFADSLEKQLRKSSLPRANILRQIKESKTDDFRVKGYFDIHFKFKKINPDFSKYKGLHLLRVFDQNHLNLFIIQSILILMILFLGFFRENPFFQIPAAMSAILLLSVLMMLVGAFAFWLRKWSIPMFIIILLFVNFISNREFFNRPHAAFGMDYISPPAEYNLFKLQEILHPDSLEKDKMVTLEILQNWRNKFPPGKVPRMIFITTSGGGQRSALWTVNVLQQANSASDGQLMKHTHLITGASGGVVGAAFFRELYMRSQYDENIDLGDKKYLDQIASDNLNPVIFTLLVNDLLIRNQYFEYNGRRYLKDRGYAFENQLNLNTKGILEKPLHQYAIPEYKSIIPMLPITPLITNDGRKLYISPHSMSYMGISHLRGEGWNEKSQAIDFLRFFADQDASNLRFISALRMGATFPFFTPHIQLPSYPIMSTMDAGLTDNFGIQDALRFIYIFQDWIRENTSGVTMITIRDSEKTRVIEHKMPPYTIEKLLSPLKNIYSNWVNVQTLKNETLFHFMKESLDFELDRIEFEYSTEQFLRDREAANPSGFVVQEDSEVLRASLNWRLTAREKKSIIDNIESPKNKFALQKVQKLEFTVPQ